MERPTPQHQQPATQMQSEEQEMGTNVMSPPAFQLTAESPNPPENPDSPVQRQDGDGDDSWAETAEAVGESIVNAGKRVVDWVKGALGMDEGGEQDAAGPETAPTVETTPEVVTEQEQTVDTPQAAANVNIDGTVGDGGDNMPEDVREVQDRLHELGYLSAADYATEQVDPAGQEAIAQQALTRTIVAISSFSQAAFGRPLLLIDPAQASQEFLNDEPDHALGSVGVGGNVGRGGANNAADVRVVQARLHDLGHLSDADYQAEQVAEDAAGQIAEADLVQTIAAIQSFNQEVTGSSLYVIRPDSLEQSALNNPPRFETSIFSLTGTVGTGGTNNAPDVIAVQTRLNGLGYLSQAHMQAEAPDAAAQGAVADAAMPETIAAINQFQQAMGLAQNGQVGVGNETHRQMMNPALPEKTDVNIGGSVGDGGAVNAHADVRRVQDRLHAIGFLTTAHYLAERVDATAQGAVNMAQVPETMSAIREFQTSATGGTDGRIDPNGRTERILNDPTYGTLTSVNPETRNEDAAVEFQNNDAALTRIIDAIEEGEGGGLQGEAPAYLLNGSGTAASYGSAQMIGTTAVGTLQNNDDVAEHYGLTDEMLDEMAALANSANGHYNDIYALVPAGGATQANLEQQIEQYTTNHTDFNETTGLGNDDIARMFHTANIRRRVLAMNLPRGAGNVFAGTNAQLNAHTDTLLGNASMADSVAAVGMNRGSVRSYLKDPDWLGENRAGFGTKAVMSHENSQELRNAMTDANGQTIGRTLIRTNYNSANGVVPAGQNQRDRTVAAITAIMHNRGGTARRWFGNLGQVWQDNYVVNFLAHW